MIDEVIAEAGSSEESLSFVSSLESSEYDKSGDGSLMKECSKESSSCLSDQMIEIKTKALQNSPSSKSNVSSKKPSPKGSLKAGDATHAFLDTLKDVAAYSLYAEKER